KCDLLWTLAVQILGDIFWFVPGYRFLSRKIDRLREILADEFAVKSGAKPEHLASSLLALEEVSVGQFQSVVYSAFFRERKILQIRVSRLIGGKSAGAHRRKPRFWLRLWVTAWTAGAVMIATFGGNHDVKVQEFPGWFEDVLKSLGF
ncbi:MAG: hypothetical protein AAB425_08240, partial [Bdellovibrionota bacterium]